MEIVKTRGQSNVLFLIKSEEGIGGASRWAILVLFKYAKIKYGVLRQEGKNGRFYEAKVALDFDL